MKKIICLLLSVVLLGVFVSCSVLDEGKTPEDNTPVVDIEDKDDDKEVIDDKGDDSKKENPENPDEPQPDDPVIEDKTVYHLVTVNKNNGEKSDLYKVADGEKVVFDAPTYNNYKLLGWFVDNERYDLNAPVTKDITLVAQWATPLTKNLTLCSGNITEKDGVYTAAGAGIMADWSDNLLYGTISATVKATTASDNGIIFGVHSYNKGSFWESEASYYFFFVNQAGFAYLGKVDKGKWSALEVLYINNYSINNSYNIKVEINGTDITCFVNNKIYLQYSEQVGFLSGGGYGIRCGASGVTITNFEVSRDIG